MATIISVATVVLTLCLSRPATEHRGALGFGNNAGAGTSSTLFFTAGIDDEQHGLFGTITAIPGDDDD